MWMGGPVDSITRPPTPECQPRAARTAAPGSFAGTRGSRLRR